LGTYLIVVPVSASLLDFVKGRLLCSVPHNALNSRDIYPNRWVQTSYDDAGMASDAECKV